jgi:hypothetical protein
MRSIHYLLVCDAGELLGTLGRKSATICALFISPASAVPRRNRLLPPANELLLLLDLLVDGILELWPVLDGRGPLDHAVER